jgi:hypothetical protein
MNKVKPISPYEIDKAKVIPDEVIEAFNVLIAKNWNGRYAIVGQEEAIEEILKRLKTRNRNKLFDEGYLDVEGKFQEVGWDVTYDSPAYNETYEPSWKFQKKQERR